MRVPTLVGYRSSAAPDLGFALGKKPGPAVARRRVVPGYAVCFLGLVGAMGAFARFTPDSTSELVASSPLFGAIYTLSVIGLVGVVTIAFLRFTLLEGDHPRLSLERDRLELGRPEGALAADVGAVRAVALRFTYEEREREGLCLLFPSGESVRIVVASASESAALDDPWDYTLDEDDMTELRRRLVRGPNSA